MSLRRGFKANANRISVRLRRSFGLRPEAPIGLKPIFARLKIEQVPLSAFRGDFSRAVDQLMFNDVKAFSAVTVEVCPSKRIVIFNDAHSPRRRNSNLAHELAHILLGHTLTLPIDTTGARNIDRDIEDEAAWLGAAILISDQAAVHIVGSLMSNEEACRIYGVSDSLLQMRINTSGARIKVSRWSRS